MIFSSPQTALDKDELRREMKARRISLNELEKARKSWQINGTLWNWFQNQWPQQDLFEADAPIGVYLARPFEISLDSLIERFLHAQYCIGAPRVNLEQSSIAFWHLESLENVENGPWNVREPRAKREIVPRVVLVPGLAFDAQGGRLGMGGGWYDRILTPQMLKIGVCLDSQIVSEVPCEDHDCAMDFVVSPTRFIRCCAP